MSHSSSQQCDSEITGASQILLALYHIWYKHFCHVPYQEHKVCALFHIWYKNWVERIMINCLMHMRRLIWGFAGRTYNIVGNLMLRLISIYAAGLTFYLQQQYCLIDPLPDSISTSCFSSTSRSSSQQWDPDIAGAPLILLALYHIWYKQFCHVPYLEHKVCALFHILYNNWVERIMINCLM